MTPVIQSKLTDRDGYGTCLSACIASLLDLPEEAIPHFGDPKHFSDERTEPEYVARMIGRTKVDWWDALVLWCWMMKRPFRYETVPEELIQPYVIAAGRSPRDPEKRRHAVIYARRTDGTYTLEHDPHPDGTGLHGEPDGFYELPLM